MSRPRKPCPQCDSQVDDPSCPRCRKRKATREYGTKRRAEFRELGFCNCGNEPAPGRKLCSKCLDRAKDAYEIRKEKPQVRVGKGPLPKHPTLLPPHLHEIIRQARREKGAYKRNTPAE